MGQRAPQKLGSVGNIFLNINILLKSSENNKICIKSDTSRVGRVTPNKLQSESDISKTAYIEFSIKKKRPFKLLHKSINMYHLYRNIWYPELDISKYNVAKNKTR